MKYIVPIVYRGQVNYLVEARHLEHARKLAKEEWENNGDSITLGNEFEEIERIGKPEKLPKMPRL